MPHILLIEDNPGDALLIREMYRDADIIGQEYTITHVQRVGEATAILQKPHTIDLILSDMSLPDSQGLETLESLTDIASELPVIFMTGTNNEAFVSAAIKAGAQDYLVKGNIDTQVLTRTTAYSIERKKAQKEFERAVKKADTLAESTELLEQQKLQLIALNTAKDEFISLASHQLRTPATAVKQYLAMITGGYAGEVPAELLPFLNTAYNANERQLNIINDLLKTAQLDSGRVTLVKQSRDLCELIQEVIDDFKPIISMREQEISFEHGENCITQIDAAELKVAISNLVENASKYSPANSDIHIRIKQDDNHVIVSVKDQGVGIAKRDIPKVFEKFTRLDNKFSDTVNGSGLGLYFVKKIARLHNGHIEVESTPSKGSVFSLTLPL